MISSTFNLDLGFSYSKTYKPANVDYSAMPLLFKDVPTHIKEIAKQIITDGWNIYTVNQSRGYCNYDAKLITIPVWCMNTRHGAGYKIWYISHELSHVFTRGDNHGTRFMNKLIEICPDEFIHHELGYKPRNAKAAGIGIAKMLDL
jgi:hypothetical protein